MYAGAYYGHDYDGDNNHSLLLHWRWMWRVSATRASQVRELQTRFPWPLNQPRVTSCELAWLTSGIVFSSSTWSAKETLLVVGSSTQGVPIKRTTGLLMAGWTHLPRGSPLTKMIAGD